MEQLIPADWMAIDGVEARVLFTQEPHARIFRVLSDWFEDNKDTDAFTGGGIYIDVPRTEPNDSPATIVNISASNKHLFGINLPVEAIQLCDAILRDSATDHALSIRSVRFIFERTGSATHAEDRLYHVDTLRIYADGDERRYDSRRSHPKYMAFVNRPGTLIVHGRIDPKLTHSEADAQAGMLWLDQDGQTHAREGMSLPIVSQLLPRIIYKVATGDLRHAPPPHDVGMLVTAYFGFDDPELPAEFPRG